MPVQNVIFVPFTLNVIFNIFDNFIGAQLTPEKKHTRNEWGRCETTLETSGEDVKTTLETGSEDANFTLETSGKLT